MVFLCNNPQKAVFIQIQTIMIALNQWHRQKEDTMGVEMNPAVGNASAGTPTAQAPQNQNQTPQPAQPEGGVPKMNQGAGENNQNGPPGGLNLS